MIAVFTNNIPLAKEMLGDFTRGSKMILIKNRHSLEGMEFDGGIFITGWVENKDLHEAYELFKYKTDFEMHTIAID